LVAHIPSFFSEYSTESGAAEHKHHNHESGLFKGKIINLKKIQMMREA